MQRLLPDEATLAGAADLRHILLLGDTETRASLRVSLEVHGLACEEAGDGDSARARVARAQFDVLIADETTPGLDLARLLAPGAGREKSPPPAIIVTSRTLDESLVSRFLAAGAHGVLKKPCPPSVLLAAVMDALPVR